MIWRKLLFNEVPKKVIYIYASRSPNIDQMIEHGLIHKAIKGLPKDFDTLERLVSPYKEQGTLLIVDDGLSQLEDYLATVFEELTHRTNTTIIFVSQATFLNSPLYRRLSGTLHLGIHSKKVFAYFNSSCFVFRQCSLYSLSTKQKKCPQNQSFGSTNTTM